MSERVAVFRDPHLRYPPRAPFAGPNALRQALETVLSRLGLDEARRGTAAWNPFGELAPRGGRIVVKPNLVSAHNLHERIEGEALAATSTHGGLLRPVLELAARAVGPGGEVIVADCPIEACELDRVTGSLGIDRVIDDLQRQGHPVRFLDLRPFRMRRRFLLDDLRRGGRSYNLGLLLREKAGGDPAGYVTVDLGHRSRFSDPQAPEGRRLRFHRSHYRTPVPHHTRGRHEYAFGQTVLGADAIIHLPKLKTHKKTGVTLSLKSAVGLSTEKYWLPHFTEGDPSVGGDELDRPLSLGEALERRLSRLPLFAGHSLVARAPRLDRPGRVLDGGWEGNDTLWRTIVDLNLALAYADGQGAVRSEAQRACLAIVDGVVGGEGDGPLGASPVPSGLLIAGRQPALVDWVAAEQMGLDPRRIPMLVEALRSLRPGADPEQLSVAGPSRSRQRYRPPASWPSLHRG